MLVSIFFWQCDFTKPVYPPLGLPRGTNVIVETYSRIFAPCYVPPFWPHPDVCLHMMLACSVPDMGQQMCPPQTSPPGTQIPALGPWLLAPESRCHAPAPQISEPRS